MQKNETFRVECKFISFVLHSVLWTMMHFSCWTKGFQKIQPTPRACLRALQTNTKKAYSPL